MDSDLVKIRTEKEISLNEISSKLNIPEKFLLAIEELNFEELPAPIFAKSQIKKYYSFFDLDPLKILDKYEEFLRVKNFPHEDEKLESSQSFLSIFMPILLRKKITFLSVIIFCLIIFAYLIFGGDDPKKDMNSFESVSENQEILNNKMVDDSFLGEDEIILSNGTDDQKENYLPRLASGEIIGSFALTEPNVGSDSANVQTKAEKDGDSYILNGTKRWITNANIANLFTVFARTDQSQKGSSGVSAFLVDANTPGISLSSKYKKMGQQGAHVCDVIFDNCRVPEVNIIGGPNNVNNGFKTAMKTLDRGRIHISAFAVGCAKRLIEISTQFSLEREQFGQSISNFQMIQAMLAESQTECYAAETMVFDAAQRRDRGEKVNLHASCCKLYASEMVGRVADRAVQIHGGAGYMDEYAVSRFYRDVRLFRIYEGTSEIQKTIIARNLLKQARD